MRFNGRWLVALGLLLLPPTLLLIYAMFVVDDHTDVSYRSDAVPFAILGDSDSHSYHDDVYFPANGTERGGIYRQHTYQWNEILAQLRNNEIDPGPWQYTGSHRWIAKLRHQFGLTFRSPYKRDFLFNFAQSGAGCNDLLFGQQQTHSLLQLVQSAPHVWQRGVVVIRIGVNDLGTKTQLNKAAANPQDAELQHALLRCDTAIKTTVTELRRYAPSMTIVVVGLFNNAHWAPNHARWTSAAEQRNIAAFVKQFDDALIALKNQNQHLIYFDDNAWFAQRWGSRDQQGRANYNALTLGNGFVVNNTVGDSPDHANVSDGHAGVVWNALWAQALWNQLEQDSHQAISLITDDELMAWFEKVLPRQK